MKQWIAMVAVALISACGGGGGSAPDTTLAPRGTYTGSFIENGQPFSLEGIVTDSGDGYFFSITGNVIINAKIDTDGNEVSGLFDSYAGIDGSEFSLVGERFASGSLVGSVSANSLTSSFQTSLGSAGAVNVTKSPANSIAGTLAEVAGTWGVNDSSGVTIIVIESDGDVIGSDDQGCQYSGHVTISPSGANAHKLSLDVNCPDGMLSMQGAVARGVPLNGVNRLAIIVHNNDFALAASLLEQ